MAGIVRTLETVTHGRYILHDQGRERIVAGFHGYGESAQQHLSHLLQLPLRSSWSLVAIHALHRFYNQKSGEVVGSWMTSLDRELAIADNIEYVRRVLDEISPDTLALLGFSQGVAMAFRAAARCGRKPAGVIAIGGDVPPDVKDDPSVQLPPVLLARGKSDELYSEEKFKDDLRFLSRVTSVTPLRYEGGHEWTDELRREAGAFLNTLP